MATTWAPMEYREFYDIPRSVLVRHDRRTYYLESEFDEQLDEYSPAFTVYLLPEDVAESARAGSWSDLHNLGRPLGSVDTAAIRFDSTKRRAVDVSGLDDLIARSMVENKAS